MSVVAYVGNFVPEHSTENHVRQAFINQGHTVIRIQEGDPFDYETLMSRMQAVDIILWTRTGDLAAKWGHGKQIAMLDQAKAKDIPTVGFHLDRWWGLDREHLVSEEPFFKCSVVITADGGHQEQFLRSGVNHVWLPPAVSLGETKPGTYRPEMTSDIVFVGSWQPGYHHEWQHRPQLIQWLSDTYGQRVAFWPKRGEHAVRGEALRDLYASTKIVVGDSCLAGGATHYWSDRIPETIGRGGFLIHPYVAGLDEHFTSGVHLETWPVGDWNALKTKIDYYLSNGASCAKIAAAGWEHVKKHHTYDVRVGQILDIIK